MLEEKSLLQKVTAKLTKQEGPEKGERGGIKSREKSKKDAGGYGVFVLFTALFIFPSSFASLDNDEEYGKAATV